MSRQSRRPLLFASFAVLGLIGAFALLGAPLSAALLGRESALFVWTSAARATLVAGTAVMICAFAAGLTVGAAAALGPPVADVLLTRVIEVSGALPAFAAVVILRALRPTAELGTIAVALAVLRGLSTAKLVRAALLELSAEDFVLSARALGATRVRLFRAHLLPHIAAPSLAEAAHSAAAVVGLDAALNLAGLGGGGLSFGSLFAEAVERGSPGGALLPAFGTAATVAAFLVLADALEDRFRVGRTFV